MFFKEGDHGEGAEGGYQSRALLPHIITALDGLHDRGVSGRPANTEFLKSLDQGGLGEPGRWLGGMALRGGFGDHDLIAGGHLGENRLTGLVTRALVGLLHVGPAKALVGNHGATRSEDCLRPVGRPSRHADLNGIAEDVGHLGGDGALPDHLVDPSFAFWHLRSHVIGMAEPVTSRADRLVGLLGVPNLLVVDPGVVRKKLGSKAFGHLGPGSGHRGVGQSGAVSPHVGDVALLVEVLGGVHGQGGRQAQFAAGLLLERGGGEWGGGTAPVGLGFHRVNGDRLAGEADGQPGSRLGLKDHCVVALDCAVTAEVPSSGYPPSANFEHRGGKGL